MLHHDLAAPQDLPIASSILLTLWSGEPAVAGFVGVLHPLPGLTRDFRWMKDFLEIDIMPHEHVGPISSGVQYRTPKRPSVTRITARTAGPFDLAFQP